MRDVLQDNKVLGGELMVPGKTFEELTGIVRNMNGKDKGLMIYHIFDFLL